MGQRSRRCAGRKKHQREQEAAGVQVSRKPAKAVACKDGIATEFGWQVALLAQRAAQGQQTTAAERATTVGRATTADRATTAGAGEVSRRDEQGEVSRRGEQARQTVCTRTGWAHHGPTRVSADGGGYIATSTPCVGAVRYSTKRPLSYVDASASTGSRASPIE